MYPGKSEWKEKKCELLLRKGMIDDVSVSKNTPRSYFTA